VNFELSEEQQLLQQTVRQFLDKECPPTQLRAIFEGETGFDPALWKGMVEMGLAGLHLPESFGGAGLEMIDLALVSEALGWGAAPGPFFGHALAGLAILLAGSEAARGCAAGRRDASTVAFDEAAPLAAEE
jgi:alkylation response protein AidB-like acyl-CoA dehydrogenase